MDCSLSRVSLAADFTFIFFIIKRKSSKFSGKFNAREGKFYLLEVWNIF